MAGYIEKLSELDREIKNKQVDRQVQEIKEIVSLAAKGDPLPQAPARLGFLPDQFEEVLSAIGLNKRPALTVMNHLLNSLRQFLALKYGIWSLANLRTANLIKQELGVRSMLEVMAGNAYWSLAFKKSGLKVQATDSLEWARTSKTGGKRLVQVADYQAEQAIAHFRQADLIFCSWAPNFGESDLRAVSAWRKFNPKSRFLFVGEKSGVTNSVAFWQQESFVTSKQMQVINRSFRSFDFIAEHIFELK